MSKRKIFSKRIKVTNFKKSLKSDLEKIYDDQQVDKLHNSINQVDLEVEITYSPIGYHIKVIDFDQDIRVLIDLNLCNKSNIHYFDQENEAIAYADKLFKNNKWKSVNDWN